MRRVGISAIVLLLAATGVVGSNPPTAPVVKVALYAPPAFHQPDQEAAPVNIVGIKNSHSEVRWVLSNTTDKAVSSVIIKSAWAAPPGCATKIGHREASETGGSRYLVSIAPHGTAAVSREDHYPWRLVDGARIWGAPYLQGQFGVIGIFFQDGTTWPTPVEDYSHTVFWDPKLLESAARNCSGAAGAAAAWQAVDANQIVFEGEAPQASEPDEGHSAIPQLHFSCTLAGPKAICHMPLESGESKAESAAAAKKKWSSTSQQHQ